MNEIERRVQLLRLKMKEDGVDFVYVPTDDFHLSEYVGDYFKCREFLTGFTGSAGTAIVSADEALLWTDGRYFLQAEQQLRDTPFRLCRMGEEGVPTVREFLTDRLKENRVLAWDARVIDAGFGAEIAALAETAHAEIRDKDYFAELWEERPDISRKPAFLISDKAAGESRIEKINFVQSMLKKSACDLTVIASLDDVMWLMNLRGNDVAYCPVLLSYAIVYCDRAIFYCHEETLGDRIVSALEKDGIEIRGYDALYSDLAKLEQQRVALDLRRVNYAIYRALKGNTVLPVENFTQLPKACKNPTELRNIRRAHIKDGVAVTKFLYWLKHSKEEKSECSAAEKLLEFRKQQKGFIEPSFETICGFQEHGAIVHYAATEQTDIRIGENGFLLVDSGGQYAEGTTDITRTIVLGRVSRRMKRDFTLVLKGHLNLLQAKFLKGTRGSVLDMLARAPLWNYGLNYNHGTGHGVGYLLNVHEGPNGISFQRAQYPVFEEGMVTSDEPGLYIAGEYGIRHENLIVCVKDEKNEYGQFLRFEPLTFVPFDLEGIDKRYLTRDDIRILNRYHREVYRKISPYLTKREQNWLKKQTRAI